MTRLTRAALLLAPLLLAACASEAPAAFDRSIATYVGQPEIRLVEALGVPQRIYDNGSQRFLEYDFTSAAAPASSGLSFGIGAGSFGYGGGYGRGRGVGTGIGLGFPLGGSGYDAAPCTVTFEVRDGRVLNFRREGDNCR
ncbi:hypothetical protein BKE38_11665 [Pseudoroseomonas deserti]|uniref:Lipoprotein n=1 Tax=Teichococcus deserti TaxID=1817963 RepID=A0A1V2H2X8_9PROT|nr:hypothetical protein [Pseudoroseomonas deserti]ONG53586.1 hypothetical protein BKE38_11665 [Pseudoroseomonas deserti]